MVEVRDGAGDLGRCQTRIGMPVEVDRRILLQQILEVEILLGAATDTEEGVRGIQIGSKVVLVTRVRVTAFK